MTKDVAELALDIGVALFAFAAAIYWFRSAYGDLPQMGSYWGSVPKDDPFFQAMQFAAEMNRKAALLSGFSAAFFGARIVVSRMLS